ncbi:hypothetical protein BDY19DRAFT_1078343 [Irpex rosettiformis]|uniref:Uncharacterized protein n=1 Tax=Irpex rosettiformis TaxID=378272 RepID=A0ACB8TPW8_9APHY|nr:hypothetical protein BDY19DRAFT_1078343 [Irpex rosettiformis]
MLRWCLSTVRNMDGRGNACYNVARSASTIPPVFQLRDSARKLFEPAVQETLSLSSKHDGRPDLSLTMPSLEERARTSMKLSKLAYADSCGVSVATASIQDHISDSTADSPPPEPAADANSCVSDESQSTPSIDSSLALPILKRLLSAMATKVTSSTPPIPTSTTLQSLYYTIKANSQLHGLTAAELSSLIAVFGSLSVSTPDQPYSFIHAHPWSKALQEEGPHLTFWPLVSELGADKLGLSQTLCASDHFWLMHLYLAQVRAQNDDELSTEQSLQAFESATVHYRAIRHTSPHPRIHAPYLEVLLGRPDGYTGVANILSQLIEEFPYVHPRILNCLWTTVLEGSTHLRAATRAQLLTAIYATSISRLKECSTASTGREHDETDTSDGTDRLPRPMELVRVLLDILSGSDSRQHRRLDACALYILETFFQVDPADSASINTAWSNLVLLALVNGPPTSTKTGIISHGSLHFRSSDWQATCILAQLEHLLCKHDERKYDHTPYVPDQVSIQRIMGSLWARWLTVKRADTLQPRELEWSILSSFLYVAGRIRDESILDACGKYLDSRLAVISKSAPSQAAVAIRQILPEYVLATMAYGYQPSDICKWVLQRADDANSVMHDALSRLVSANPVLAHELCVASDEASITIDRQTIVSLGKHLTHSGYIELALEYTNHKSLGLAERAGILETVIQAFIDRPRDIPHTCHWDTLASVVVAFLPLYPSDVFRALVTTLVFTMLDKRHAVSAIPIIQSTFHLSPEFFPLRKMPFLVDLLIQHSQYRLADQVFRRYVENGPTNEAWQKKVIEKLARAGAHHVAFRAATYLPRSTPPYQTTLLKAVKYRVKSPSIPSALRIQSILSRSKQDGASVLLGMELLIAAGRIKAARDFYERECHHLTASVRTAAGNQLIHAYFAQDTRESPHRMKAALRILNDLTVKCQFVADRITMNILVKGLLRWTEELDQQSIRALFDRLILSGYPTGGLYDPGEAPFGSTRQQQELGVPLPEVTTPILFKKHARPLYKMFIKGLYVRGDAHGAKKVVGVLKAAQDEWEEKFKKRNPGFTV